MSADTGHVLPAVTSVASGAAVLPATGENSVAMLVAMTAIVLGSAVLLSAVAKRVAIRMTK